RVSGSARSGAPRARRAACARGDARRTPDHLRAPAQCAVAPRPGGRERRRPEPARLVPVVQALAARVGPVDARELVARAALSSGHRAVEARSLRLSVRAALRAARRVRLPHPDSHDDAAGARRWIRGGAPRRRRFLHRDALLGSRRAHEGDPAASPRSRRGAARRTVRAGRGALRMTRAVYDDAYARKYRSHDDELDASRPYHDLVAWLQDVSRRFGGPFDALDLGCGTGRYFWAVTGARTLTGVDRSAPMLAEAAAPVHADRITARAVALVAGDLPTVEFAVGAFDL